jgi:hypothetical protein
MSFWIFKSECAADVGFEHHQMFPRRIIRYIESAFTSAISNSRLQKANATASVGWHPVCECQGVRNRLFILAGVILTGCATQQPAMRACNTAPIIAHASAALVFDAPITFSEPEIDIPRDDRGAAAFMGFDDGSTTNYDIVSYSRQSSDRGDRYVQQAITEKTGSLQR